MYTVLIVNPGEYLIKNNSTKINNALRSPDINNIGKRIKNKRYNSLNLIFLKKIIYIKINIVIIVKIVFESVRSFHPLPHSPVE